jgi:hypothetical protein
MFKNIFRIFAMSLIFVLNACELGWIAGDPEYDRQHLQELDSGYCSSSLNTYVFDSAGRGRRDWWAPFSNVEQEDAYKIKFDLLTSYDDELRLQRFAYRLVDENRATKLYDFICTSVPNVSRGGRSTFECQLSDSDRVELTSKKGSFSLAYVQILEASTRKTLVFKDESRMCDSVFDESVDRYISSQKFLGAVLGQVDVTPTP